MLELLHKHHLGKTTLPNSICLTPDGLVGCSAKNTIFRLNSLGEMKELFGSEGFGKNKFRQPVGVNFSHGLLFVLDWHNHRIVIYESYQKYVGELGELTVQNFSALRTKLLRFKSIILSHQYILNHFSLEPRIEKQNDHFLRKSVRLFNFLFRRTLLCRNAPFHKPNGVVIIKDMMVVTQKDRRSVQFYNFIFRDSRPYFSLQREVRKINNKAMGRLGNCVHHSQRIFVCDETQHSVLVFSLSGDLLQRIILQKEVPVFCCCVLDSDHILVGGESVINLVNIRSQRADLIISDFGEIHSMVYDKPKKKLFVADRQNGIIREYRVKFSGGRIDKPKSSI